MKFLKQMCLIVLFSFLGELFRFLIPFPIPASIYGMVFLFGALSLKLITVDSVRETGSFLTSFLPVMFVAPVVNLLDCWDVLKGNLIPLLAITLVSTVIVFFVSGHVTQLLIKKGGKKNA